MKKIKIKDKVELEGKIDEFLKEDIPLSIFTEIYDLTYPQFKLFINRAYGYTNQTQKIEEKFGYTGTYDETYLDIPHVIEEKYPLVPEEQRNLFLRLNELREKLERCNGKKLLELKQRITDLRQELDKFEIYKEQIQRIISFLSDRDELIKKNSGIDSYAINYLLIKNNIDINRLSELNKIYDSYKKCVDDLQQAELTLQKEEEKLKEENIKMKDYQKEFDNIKELLVTANIKLVNWCIRKFFNNIPLPKEDTQMVGIEGLLKAIDGFDPNYTYKTASGQDEYIRFSSYAVKIIITTIEKQFNELYGMDWKTYISKEVIKHYRKLTNEISKSSRFVTPEELVSTGLIDFTVQKVAELDSIPEFVIPFSEAYAEQEKTLDEKTSAAARDLYVLSDFDGDIEESANEANIETRNFPMQMEEYEAIDEYEDDVNITSNDNILEIISNESLRNALEEILDTLTYREKEILKYRFGLKDGATKTLDEVAIIFGVTRERVRQIENKAIRKLRHPSRAKKVRDYYVDTAFSSGRNNRKPSIDKISRAYLKLIQLENYFISDDRKLVYIREDGLDWNANHLEIALANIEKIKSWVKQGFDITIIKRFVREQIDPDLYLHEVFYLNMIRKYSPQIPMESSAGYRI